MSSYALVIVICVWFSIAEYLIVLSNTSYDTTSITHIYVLQGHDYFMYTYCSMYKIILEKNIYFMRIKLSL